MSNQSFPIQLSNADLDLYLENGWYRMNLGLFTLNYIYLDKWIRVFWLRFELTNFAFNSKSHKELLKKNEKFQVTIKPAVISKEHEKLYKKYRKNVDFDCSISVSNCLFNEKFTETPPKSIFDSKIIEVRDNKRLIAVGVFDQGKDSIAGILNFYDPEYSKFSLGKFLILKKIEYALTSGMEWYYPGYIGVDFPKFDYKLFAGAQFAQIYDPVKQNWVAYSADLIKQLTKAQANWLDPFGFYRNY